MAVAKLLPLLLCALSLSHVLGDNNVTTMIDENELGMEGYFKIVKEFLGEVVQRKNISESFLNLSTIFVDGKLDEDSVTDWEAWAEYLIGYAVCAALGLLFVVVMPLTGLIFCCCRLCGRCGGKRKDHESKRSACKRRCYCTTLLILNTLMLGGAICGLVSNTLLQEHLENDNNKGTLGFMQQGLGQFEDFVNDSVLEISSFVHGEFDTVSASVLQKMNESAQNAVDAVLDELNATALLQEAKDVSAEADAIAVQLDTVATLLGELIDSTNSLSNNLTDIKTDVEEVCDAESCLWFDANDYQVQSNFSGLSDLKDEASDVAKSLNMSQYIADAEESIESAKAEASKSVADETEKAEQAIKDVEDEINTGLSDLETQKNDALNDVDNFRHTLDDFEEDYVLEYSDYIYYGGLGACCLFLLIIALFYIGVLYGLCGERPGDGAPCCNTGTGANFLIGGVFFTFFLTWLLMILCTILFLLGGPAYTEVCRYFDGHEPSKFKVFDDAITNGLDLTQFYSQVPPDLSIVETLQDCQKNDPVFSALNLDYIVNLDEILNTSSLSQEIEKLKNTDITVPVVDILNDELLKDLQGLANAGLNDIDFESYYAQLNVQVTSAPLGDLATSLDAVASEMSDGANKQKLQSSVERLRTLEDNDVQEISKKMVELNNTLKALEEQGDLSDSINRLIANLNTSQTNFNNNGETLVKEQITDLADTIEADVTASVDNIKQQIKEEMLGCQPLSDAFYTVSDSVCILLIRPLNGFWFSIGWCLILSIPCLVMAVLLAGQYRREHEYIKDFEEPRGYLMYGGGPSPDTIPLTSRSNWDN